MSLEIADEDPKKAGFDAADVVKATFEPGTGDSGSEGGQAVGSPMAATQSVRRMAGGYVEARSMSPAGPNRGPQPTVGDDRRG